jgi:hypothetical protein
MAHVYYAQESDFGIDGVENCATLGSGIVNIERRAIELINGSVIPDIGQFGSEVESCYSR